MTLQLVRVDWQGHDIYGGSGSFVFDDLESVTIKRDSGAKESMATIVLKNPYDRFQTGFTQPFTKYNSNVNDIRFKEGDTVKIYAAEVTSYREIDTSTTSSDLIMTGEVAEVTVRGTEQGSKITLQVVDKTYTVLSFLHTNAYLASENLTAPQIVQQVVRFIADDTHSYPLAFDDNGNLVGLGSGKYVLDARLVSEGTADNPGFIEDTRNTGVAFPSKTSMAKVAKPAYEWVKDLSAIEYTNNFDGRDSSISTDNDTSPPQDRNMIFYVDEKNRFHWFYPQDVATTTLSSAITSSQDTIPLTLATNFSTRGAIFIGTERIDYTGKSSNTLTGATRGANNTSAASHSSGDTVKSAISLIEGETTAGYRMLGFNLTKVTFDIVNVVKFSCGADLYGNGITSYYFDRSTKSKTLKWTSKTWNEIASQLIQGEISASTPRLTQDNAVTSAFTFKGNRYKESTGAYTNVVPGWQTATVASDTAYNNSLRAKCIQDGKSRAQALTRKRGSPRWKGTFDMKFHRFHPGDLIEFTSTRAGINKVALRIMTAQYNFTSTGAFTTLQVEEDEQRLR